MSEADLVIPGYSPNTQNHVVQIGQKVRVRVIGVFTNTIPVAVAKIGNTLTLFYLTLTIIEILKKCVPRVKSYLS